MDYEKKIREYMVRSKVDQLYKSMLINLFPELKESEDERIRKALIELVHDTTGDSLWVDYNVHKEDALAWLEKQGENIANKVEPKFKQGDIIKEKETGNLFYVNSVEDFGYTLHYKNCIEKGCVMSFKYEDNYELVEQASEEKDLELTWEDISIIRQIMFDYNRQIREEMSIPNDKEYCEEILKRFKERKENAKVNV